AALARTQWPGRLERVVIEGAPPLLLDGAHNPAAARALAAYLRDAVPFVLVFGVMADKDVEVLTRILFPLAQSVLLPRRPPAAAGVAHDGEGDAGATHERLQRGAVIVDGDTQDHQALAGERAVQPLERRHLLDARRAPRRPEVHEHHVAAIRLQVHFRALEGR